MKAVAAMLLALVLTACNGIEAGPKCIKSHTEVRQEIAYTPECALGIDGKFDCGTFKPKLVTRTHTVCDQYEEPVAKES